MVKLAHSTVLVDMCLTIAFYFPAQDIERIIAAITISDIGLHVNAFDIVLLDLVLFLNFRENVIGGLANELAAHDHL